jgi:hypothetical protein
MNENQSFFTSFAESISYFIIIIIKKLNPWHI